MRKLMNERQMTKISRCRIIYRNVTTFFPFLKHLILHYSEHFANLGIIMLKDAISFSAKTGETILAHGAYM